MKSLEKITEPMRMVGLVLALFMAITVSGAAGEREIERKDSALEGLIDFLDSQSRDSGGLALRLDGHPGFQAFMASEGHTALFPKSGPANVSRREDALPVENGTATSSRELIFRYLESVFSLLDDVEHLRSRQAEALRLALWHHGLTSSGPQDGFACLAEVSAANRDALLRRPRVAVPPAAAEEIEQAIATIRPVFIHNTNLLKKIPEIPLVSSKEIRRAAGVGGINTFFFNRSFLRSDDNLFFFVDLATDSLTVSMMESIYGKYQFVPDETFAEERGWISAFVMYAYDLLRFAAVACPEEVPALIEVMRREYLTELGSEPLSVAEINQRLRHVRRAAPRSVRVLRDGFPRWNRIRKNLYTFDFTVRDFTVVVRDAFRRWLSGLATSDPARFATTLRELREKGPGGSQLEAFKQGFGLDLYFEFKIPVALPPKQMRQLETMN